MSSLAESVRAARPALSRTHAIRTARKKDFVAAALFAVVGLLVSAFLAILLNIPAAETLLQMPV